MSFTLTAENISKIILWTVLWVLLGVLSTPLMATTEENSRSSKSISFIKSSAPDKSTKDTQLRQVDADILPALSRKGFRIESTMKALHMTTDIGYSSHQRVSIYNASTRLISDDNDNGFFHRFSITIDADTIYHSAYIYARLYLSFEGGPWDHYASSDSFPIFGDSVADTLVIETELSDGFLPGYYDVRIELYDADDNHWLLSYGPFDDASLSALPLEDSYYDSPHENISIITPVETNIVVAAHAGSISWLFAFLAIVIVTLRRYSLFKLSPL